MSDKQRVQKFKNIYKLDTIVTNSHVKVISLASSSAVTRSEYNLKL